MGAKMKFLPAGTYLRDQWRLAAAVRRSGWRPDVLLGLWRGGAPVAVAVHEFLSASGWRVAHVPLKCASYDGIGRQGDAVVFTLGDETFSLFRRGQKVLVVDDVFDSGKTIAAVRRRLEAAGAEMRSACVYWKPAPTGAAAGRPDYFVRRTGGDWIVFPHEIDGLSAAAVRRKSAFLSRLLGERTPPR